MPLGKEKESDAARYKLSAGTMSDHLMLYNAFTQWDSIGHNGAKNDFAWKHFLAPTVLNMLKDMKRDMAENLKVGRMEAIIGNSNFTVNVHLYVCTHVNTRSISHHLYPSIFSDWVSFTRVTRKIRALTQIPAMTIWSKPLFAGAFILKWRGSSKLRSSESVVADYSDLFRSFVRPSVRLVWDARLKRASMGITSLSLTLSKPPVCHSDSDSFS